MRRSTLQNSWRHSWLRNVCKIAVLAAAIGLALPPRESLAAACLNYCSPHGVCPQFLAQYCVMWPDGQRSTIWTNPCFACHATYCVLYMGTCKPVIPLPPTCKGTKCY